MHRIVPEPEQCLALASMEGGFDALVFNAVFAALYGCGLFLSELLDLCPRDVLPAERMRIEIGGTRARTLPLPKGTADRLTLVLDAIGTRPRSSPIFSAAPIWCNQSPVNLELKRRSLMLGFARPLSIKDLRLAFAQHMAEKQTRIEIIAHMMGYESMSSVLKLLTMSNS
jgi:integrase/recombinase XerC